MATALEKLQEFGIALPTYRPDPANRDKARDDYRRALQVMQEQYREATKDLRYPPEPGPRPKQYEDAPPFPHAVQYPPEPQRPEPPIGLTAYPSNEEITVYVDKGGPVSDKFERLATQELRAKAVQDWQKATEEFKTIVEAWRPKWQAVHEAEQAEQRAYAVRNEEWLDTVFYPGEAERALWEVAHEVFQESQRAIRAEADLARDELDILRAKRERAAMEKEAAPAAPPTQATPESPTTPETK